MSVKLADNAKIFKITDERLLMNSDTFHGNSGSPVFNKYNRVIGILVSGEDDFGFIISQRKSFTIEYNKNESKENKEEIENFILKLKEEGIADIERFKEGDKISYKIMLPEGVRINLHYHPYTVTLAKYLKILENAYAYYNENDPREEAQRINSTIKQLVPLTKEERFLCRKIQNNMIRISNPYKTKQIDPQLNMLYKNLQCDKDKEI